MAEQTPRYVTTRAPGELHWVTHCTLCGCVIHNQSAHDKACLAALAGPTGPPPPEPDVRDPKPCPRCGQTCTYDGWDHVHADGLGIRSCGVAASGPVGEGTT